MDDIAPRSRVDDDDAATRSLRRVLITVGLVVAVLILVAVAIYAGAFIILAPMMQ
jgi:CHASE3 domain sensor protein